MRATIVSSSPLSLHWRTLAVAALAISSTASQAAVLTFGSTLGPEVPEATGSGSVTLWYDTVEMLLMIDAQWTGLSGLTTVSHIHCCTPSAGTGTIGIAVTPVTLPGFPVGVSSGAYSQTIDLKNIANFTASFITTFGSGSLEMGRTALLDAFQNGTAYFNIHSSIYPAGEIRGFIGPVSVPEPGTLWLLGIGLAGVGLARRRKASAAT